MRKVIKFNYCQKECDNNVKKDFETLKSEVTEQIKSFSKNYNRNSNE